MNTFNITDSEDFINLFLGEKIGSGVYRDVYENKLDRSTVIKHERGKESFANVLEWEIWREISDIPSLSKYFAPCLAISPCGRFLIQQRTYKPIEDDYPEKVPSFFLDNKFDNYGVILHEPKGKQKRGKRQFVVHDYANFSLANGMKDGKLVKAEWWGDKQFYS